MAEMVKTSESTKPSDQAPSPPVKDGPDPKDDDTSPGEHSFIYSPSRRRTRGEPHVFFLSRLVSQWDSNVRRVCVSANKSVSSEPEFTAPVTRSRRGVTRDASVIPHVSSFLFLPDGFSSIVGCFDPVCSPLENEL